MTDILVLVENSWPIILFFIGLIIVYFIIHEIRVMYTRTTEAKIGLEKEKINLMRTDMEQKGRPFFKVSPEKLQEIKVVDEENTLLETDIFARHTEVEKRIERLENKVQVAKLDRMVEKIKREEERIG